MLLQTACLGVHANLMIAILQKFNMQPSWLRRIMFAWCIANLFMVLAILASNRCHQLMSHALQLCTQNLQLTIQSQKDTMNAEADRATQEIAAMASLITSFQSSTLELLQSKASTVQVQPQPVSLVGYNSYA